MNITEANELNHVLDFLLGIKTHPEIDEATARAAASRLAERAYKALSAGLDGTTVREAWDRYQWRGRRRKKGAK